MHSDTLSNGLQVIVVENHSIPLVTTEIVFRAGAMTQTEEDQGIPHLFEHMLFRSYRGGLGQPFNWDAAKARAAYNGATSDEDVSYFLTVPSANTNDAMGMVARLVRDAHFENVDFQRERFIVMNEAQRDASDPQFHLEHETEVRLWGNGFSRKNTIGDETSLMSVTIAQLNTIFKRYYVPNNAALIVSGDISAQEGFEMARSHFEGWKRQPNPFATHPVAAMPALDSSRAVVISGNVTAITLEVAWQGPSVSSDPKGTYAADVLSEIVNDDQSGFHTRLVDSGVFQEVELGYSTRAHTGPITFHGITTAAKLTDALTTLYTELDYMAEPGYFSPAIIAAAAKRREVSSVLRLENPHDLAFGLAEAWAVASTDYFRSYSDHVASTTEKDLRSYVERYLIHKPFVIAALVPPDRTAETATLLAEVLGEGKQ
jgi:zinc protease